MGEKGRDGDKDKDGDVDEVSNGDTLSEGRESDRLSRRKLMVGEIVGTN